MLASTVCEACFDGFSTTICQRMIDYHIDEARKLIITRGSGRLSFSDFEAYLQRLARDPKFSPDFNGLVVALDVAAMPNTEEVASLIPLIRDWSRRRTGVKWAIVLPDRASRDRAESALSRMKLTTVTARCFLSETAARAWLS
jgi:hypothetical protein